MGNEESKYKNELNEIKNSLHDLLNLKKNTKIIPKKRINADRDKIKSSQITKSLNNSRIIPLLLEILIRGKKDYITSYNNIDISKSIFNSNIYFENPKSKKKDTTEDEFYSEQIKLIDDLNEGSLFYIFEDEIVEKENTEIDNNENKEEIEEDEEKEIRPKKDKKTKEYPKTIENETYNKIKKKNEEFLRKVSSKKEVQKMNQENERSNNNTGPKTVKHQQAFEDLSIEEYLKKETKRIKSIYGNDFHNEIKPNDQITDDTTAFDMRKNKHLEAIYNTKHPDKLSNNKHNQDNIKHHKQIIKHSNDNEARKNGDNINKSMVSNNKSVLTNHKQINIKIDLSKYIPPENANKSFTSKTKSFSPGVRINYYDKSPSTNSRVKNTGNLMVGNQDISRDNIYVHTSKEKVNKYNNSIAKTNGIITFLI